MKGIKTNQGIDNKNIRGSRILFSIISGIIVAVIYKLLMVELGIAFYAMSQ